MKASSFKVPSRTERYGGLLNLSCGTSHSPEPLRLYFFTPMTACLVIPWPAELDLSGWQLHQTNRLV